MSPCPAVVPLARVAAAGHFFANGLPAALSRPRTRPPGRLVKCQKAAHWDVAIGAHRRHATGHFKDPDSLRRAPEAAEIELASGSTVSGSYVETGCFPVDSQVQPNYWVL